MAKYEIPLEQLKELQSVSLTMMLYFDKFCRENNLMYYMCGGGCIGAVRNSGFIPWDDDLDVFMPRQDYIRFEKLWKDTKRYSLEINTDTYICRRPFFAIHDNSTTFIHSYRKDMDVNHGVALDILPLDGCPKGFKRKLQKLWAMAFSLFIVGKSPENHGKMIKIIGDIVLFLFPLMKIRYHLWKFCEKKMTQYPISECDAITELCSGPHYMQNEYPKNIFGSGKFVEFEGHMLTIPHDYDTYLKIAFGNYMELPPVEKRVCHHEYEFMDMNNGYEKYRGVYYCVEE